MSASRTLGNVLSRSCAGARLALVRAMPRPLVRRQPPLSLDEYGFWSPQLIYALAMRGIVRVSLPVCSPPPRRSRRQAVSGTSPSPE